MSTMAGMTALVTGATHGIGAAIARGFAGEGARVLVHGRDEGAGEALAEEIGGAFLSADLSSFAGVDSLIAQTRALVQTLDVLVNNAGVEVGATLPHLQRDVLLETMFINFHAPVLTVQGLLPLLSSRPRGAAVINVASIHSSVPAYGNTAYSSSKAALHMFTKTASIELSQLGVRVNTLSPGAVLTDHNRTLIEEVGTENFKAWIPAGRVAEADELVGAAIFLATKASSYVTGAELVIDGGYSNHLVRYRSSDHQ